MRALAIILIVLFCPVQGRQVTVECGIYKTITLSKFEQAWMLYVHGIQRRSVGNQLTVYPDSTFVYSTCAIIGKGRWNVDRDTLFLKMLENRWKNDSLNKHGFKGTWPKIPAKPFGFRIDGDRLERIYIHDDGSKSIEELRLNAK